MANGLQHEKAILIATGTTIISSIIFSDNFPLSYLVFANIGMISNVFVSNDHDQDGSTLPELRTAQLFTWWIPNYKIKNYLNDKIIRLIKIFFSPYAMWFKHRSMWTHLPPICTIIRCSYIYIMIWYLFMRNWEFGDLFYLVYNNYLYESIIFLIFVCIGDIIHTTLDKWEIYW